MMRNIGSWTADGCSGIRFQRSVAIWNMICRSMLIIAMVDRYCNKAAEVKYARMVKPQGIKKKR